MCPVGNGSLVEAFVEVVEAGCCGSWRETAEKTGGARIFAMWKTLWKLRKLWKSLWKLWKTARIPGYPVPYVQNIPAGILRRISSAWHRTDRPGETAGLHGSTLSLWGGQRAARCPKIPEMGSFPLDTPRPAMYTGGAV